MLPRSGLALIEEIDHAITATPTLWWLGHSAFIVRFANITFYIDPCLSCHRGETRLIAPPIDPEKIRHADMILATHAHPRHLDTASISAMLAASKNAKLVLPKSAAAQANAAGIPFDRMATTDADLRIEYFKDNLYGRIYAVPSAHPDLGRSADGGYPFLGYIVRFGRWNIYHAGDCAFYDGLAARLRPFNISVALLPVGGKNFSVSEAARIARDIGAAWVVPMHYGTFTPDDGAGSHFIEHMLGHRPEQPFKVFQCGEKWTVPEE
ncbi:MAG: MBL fold metallo-hydrolase [Bryobacteraceae bacterium]